MTTVDRRNRGIPTIPSRGTLTRHPRALFTPHVGGYTDHSYALRVERAVDNLRAVALRGQPPTPWVNQIQIPTTKMTSDDGDEC